MNYRTNAHLSNKITCLYLLALSAVALLLVGGQFVVQQSLRSQLTDSRVMNIAGRQRMLRQKIAPAYLIDLDNDLTLWEKSHVRLKNGYLTYPYYCPERNPVFTGRLS